MQLLIQTHETKNKLSWIKTSLRNEKWICGKNLNQQAVIWERYIFFVVDDLPGGVALIVEIVALAEWGGCVICDTGAQPSHGEFIVQAVNIGYFVLFCVVGVGKIARVSLSNVCFIFTIAKDLIIFRFKTTIFQAYNK